MHYNKKLSVVRSESVDTERIDQVAESFGVKILYGEEAGKVGNGNQKSIIVHKKMMSFPFVSAEMDESGFRLEENFLSGWKVRMAFRNIDKILRIFMIVRFNQWKCKSSTRSSQKLYGMISVLQRIFMKRGKRVFQPPRVIKDADEIMRRTLKKLIQIKQRLFDYAFARWKYFKLALYTKEKAVTFYRACRQAGHIFFEAFQNWKSKTVALESIKRTAATDKFQRVLQKCFRGRFKLFVFSTYFKMGPKKAVSKIFALLNKRYIEDRRVGLENFKSFLRVSKRKSQQIRNDRKLFRLFWTWSKAVKSNLKRGWVAFRQVKRNRVKLIRLIVRKFRMRRNQAWDIWKGVWKGRDFKYMGFKMQGAVERVTRRQQRWGFVKFLRENSAFGSVSGLKNVYKKVLAFGFHKIQLLAKDNQIAQIKDNTRFIRANHRKTQLRNTKLTGKSLSLSLQRLLKKYYTVLISAHKTIKSRQLPLKLCAKYLLSKPKSSIFIWKQFVKKEVVTVYKMSKCVRNMKPILKKCFKHFVRFWKKTKKFYLLKWKIRVMSAAKGDFFNNFRNPKLVYYLSKYPHFNIKEYFFKISKKNFKSKLCIERVLGKFTQRLKNIFAKWTSFSVLKKRLNKCRKVKLKRALSVYSYVTQIRYKRFFTVLKDYVVECNKRVLLGSIKSYKFKSKLERMVFLQMKKYFIRTVGAGKRISRKFISQFYTGLYTWFAKWKVFNRRLRQRSIAILKNVEKLKNFLSSLGKRVYSQVFNRLIIMRPLKLTLKKLMNHCNSRIKSIWNRWKQRILVIYHGKESKKFQDKARAIILNFAIKKIKINRLRSIRGIISSTPIKLKIHLKTLIFSVRERLKHVLYSWKDRVNDKSSKRIKDGALFLCMYRISTRMVKLVFDKIINRSKAYVQLKRIFKSFSRSQKQGFYSWKTQTSLLKIAEKFNKLKTTVFIKAFATATQRVKLLNFTKIVEKPSTLLLKLCLFSFTTLKSLRTLFRTWHSSTQVNKTHLILTQFQAKRLKTSINRLIKKSFSLFTHKLLHPFNPMRKFLLLWLQNLRFKLKQSLITWERFKEKVNKGELLDAVRSVNLRKFLENIPKKLLRDTVDRVLGHGNKVRGHLRRIILQLQKSLLLGFSTWKNYLITKKSSVLWLKLKSGSLKSTLSKLLEKQLKSSIDRIIGNGKMAFGKILRVFAHFKFKYLNCFCRWKENVGRLKQRDTQRASNLVFLLSRIAQKGMKILLEAILGDTRVRTAIEKLVKNLKNQQFSVLQILWGRVEKIRTIRKMNSAFILSRQLTVHFKQSLKTRFLFWKNLESLRKKRILRKAIGKLIQNMSINFESGLWKWKFIMTSCGKQLNPRHSIFFKRLLAITSSYQIRLEQFALFKIVLNFKSLQLSSSRVTLPKAIAKIIKDNEIENKPKTPIHYDRIIKYAEESGNKMVQMGALEILFLSLNGIKLRKLSWVLSAIYANFRYIDCVENEKTYFKEQISELRYERSSLLEDNNILRVHNDNLINSLEKNTEDLQEISLNMDFLRISSMFKSFTKVLETNLLSSFYKLRLGHQDI